MSGTHLSEASTGPMIVLGQLKHSTKPWEASLPCDDLTSPHNGPPRNCRPGRFSTIHERHSWFDRAFCRETHRD